MGTGTIIANRNCTCPHFIKIRVSDVTQGGRVQSRTQVVQQKTQRPIQFEITDQARRAEEQWIAKADLDPSGYLFPSRIKGSPHVSTRQYARIVQRWVASIGLDPTVYGTHSLRRTKASLIHLQLQDIYERPADYKAQSAATSEWPKCHVVRPLRV